MSTLLPADDGLLPAPAADAGRFRMLLILSACVVLALTPWFSAAAVMPQLRAAWHISARTASFLTISVQLGFVLGAIISAVTNLSDLVSPRHLIAASCLGAAATNLALNMAPDPAIAFVLRLLTGGFLAGVYPPALKLISTWFRRQRGLALGTVIGALTLGSAAPHLIDAFGAADWRTVIVVTSAATALSGLGTLLVVRDGPYPFPRAAFDAAMIGRSFRNRGVLLATGGYLGHMWELYAMWSWLLIYARHVFANDGHLASLLTFITIAAGAPACVVAGFLADRFGRPATTIALMTISGLCAASIGASFHGPGWLFVVISLVWGASVVADSAQFSAVITEIGDPRYVGTALTTQLGSGFALTAVTIWLLPVFADWLGSWQWVFLILVPGPALGTLAMAILRRRPEAHALAGGHR